MVDGSNLKTLPLLTESSERIRGTIKERPEDFQVEEIPLYEAGGDGPHLYFEMTKRNMTTDAAVKVLADHFDRSPSEFGVAGKKDRQAVTTQRISLEHVEPEDVEAFEHERIELEVLDRHRNKIQPGHLEGNRFTVKVRTAEPAEAGSTVKKSLASLSERGVPNYFGSQRFGRRRDTDDLGEAMVHGELDEFLDLYFGRPREVDPPECRRARELYEEGSYGEAIDAWPDDESNKRRGLAAYVDRRSPGPVLSAISKSRRQLFLSAYQSRLFNELLAERMPHIDSVLEGDVARKTDTGGMFEVKDPDGEQPRAAAFDISPTGLLPGRDPWYASVEPGDRERYLLEENNLNEGDFEKVGYLRSDGTRRIYRFSPGSPDFESKSDEHGPYLKLHFRIPSGCYATVLLRELLKSDPPSVRD